MADKNYEITSSNCRESISAPLLAYRPKDPENCRPNIGLIGCGAITASHLRAYVEADYRVVAVCDVNAVRAEERRRELYPDADVYSDF